MNCPCSVLPCACLPYALAFFSSLCIMILELVSSRLVARHVGALADGLDQRDRRSSWAESAWGTCWEVAWPTASSRGGPSARSLRVGVVPDAGSLWMNAVVGYIFPPRISMHWELRTVLVVVLDFLIPATVLGMVGPVVAKMAVEQAQQGGQRDRRRLLLGSDRLDRRHVPLRLRADVPGADLDDRALGRRGPGALAGVLIRTTPCGLSVGLVTAALLLAGLDRPAGG